MQTLNFQSLFGIWISRTSSAVMIGDAVIAGGQAHIAFGRSGDEIRSFLAGTNIIQAGQRWQLPIESQTGIASRELPLYENPSTNQRLVECRIPSQRPNSRLVYPLWQKVVRLLPEDAPPEQLLLILRDKKQFHIRVLEVGDLSSHLPLAAVQFFIENRRRTAEHHFKGTGVFSESSWLPLPPTPITRPKKVRKIDIKGLADYVRQVRDAPRQTRVNAIETKLRDSRVRDLSLLCFGARCQVKGCRMTRGLSPQEVELVLEAHHLLAVAKGGSDSLFNLTVLCANHHRLCERLPSIRAQTLTDTDDVLMTYDNGSFLIERDLKELKEELKGK